MRSLSATLLAAQRSESRRPYVRAVFDDYDGDRARLRFSRYYTGAEVEGPVAAVVTPAGTLIRARIDPGTNTLYTSRVASPGAGSDYSSWTSHGVIVAAGTYVAVGLWNANPQLFYVHTDGVGIRSKASGDDGATWTGAVTVATGAAAVTYLAMAAAVGGSGAPDLCLFWSEGATVCRSRYTSVGWGARTVWTNTIAGCTGLAVEYQGDWVVAVCGTAVTSTDGKAWTCLFGDGLNQAANTWSALGEAQTATAGSGVTYLSPAVEFMGCWRLFFDEKYTGSLAYSRLQWATMGAAEQGNAELWREPQAFAYTGDYGLACAASATGLWLAAAAGVWFGALPAAAATDVSADVVEAEVSLEPERGRARIVLDNSAGLYAAAAAGGIAVGVGRRLALSFGFYGTAGLETSDGPRYWVESVEWRHERDGRATVEVTAVDAWGYLAGWRARRQFLWAAGAKNISQLVTFLFARAGLDYASLSNSSSFVNLTPAFTVHAGESGLAAVRRLLEKVPDVVIMRSGAGRTLYPQASDASAYSYGGAHVIASARYRTAAAAVNRARAFGVSLFDERFDFGDAEASGERVEQVLDLGLTTTALAGDRASFMLRAAAYGEISDELVAPLNAGQELYDVVDVTDAGAGLAAVKRRVLSCVFRWSALRRPSRTPSRTSGGASGGTPSRASGGAAGGGCEVGLGLGAA